MARSAIESSRSRVQRALKLSALFDRAARATREAAIAATTMQRFERDRPIASQGAPLDAVLVIFRGRARVVRSAGGDRVVPLGYRGAGEIVGEAGAGGAATHAESAIAMEEVEAAAIDAAKLRALLAADAGLGAAMLDVILTRRREIEARIESLLFRDVDARLSEFLLRAGERWGVPNPNGRLISAPVTHLEIAQTIGSTRETVTLALGALKRDGVIGALGRRMILRDEAELERRARGAPRSDEDGANLAARVDPR